MLYPTELRARAVRMLAHASRARNLLPVPTNMPSIRNTHAALLALAVSVPMTAQSVPDERSPTALRYTFCVGESRNVELTQSITLSGYPGGTSFHSSAEISRFVEARVETVEGEAATIALRFRPMSESEAGPRGIPGTVLEHLPLHAMGEFEVRVQVGPLGELLDVDAPEAIAKRVHGLGLEPTLRVLIPELPESATATEWNSDLAIDLGFGVVRAGRRVSLRHRDGAQLRLGAWRSGVGDERDAYRRWRFDLSCGVARRAVWEISDAVSIDGVDVEVEITLRADAFGPWGAQGVKAYLADNMFSDEICESIESEGYADHPVIAPLLDRAFETVAEVEEAIAAVEAAADDAADDEPAADAEEGLDAEFAEMFGDSGGPFDEVLEELERIREEVEFNNSPRGKFVLAAQEYLGGIVPTIRKEDRFDDAFIGLHPEEEVIVAAGRVATEVDLEAFKALLDGLLRVDPQGWPVRYRIRVGSD